MRARNINRTVLGLALLAAGAALTIAPRQHPPRPTTPDRSLWRRNVVYRVPTTEKVAALTYDDGPSPVFTPELLRILDRYQVKATFFMIGSQVAQYPSIAKDVAARGHVIGNHTYTHPHMEGCTWLQIVCELARCEQVIERAANRRPILFRPPSGFINRDILAIASEGGYRIIQWTVSADHQDAPTPEMMPQRVLKHLEPGVIILAHEGDDAIRRKDVQATPLIIESLRKRGYRFVTVPELLELGRTHPRGSGRRR